MAFYLSPIAVVIQYLNDQGIILSGGKIFTYNAGTSNLAVTYTDITGTVANSNPIVLDGSGRLPNVSIWQAAGTTIKYVITDAQNNPIGQPIDQVAGVNDTTNILSIVNNLITTAVNSQSTTFLTNIAVSAINATITKSFIQNILNPFPITTAEIAQGVTPANVQYPVGNVLRYGADPTGTKDSTAAIQTAIDVLNNWENYTSSLGNKTTPGIDFSQGGEVFIPGGLYLISNTIKLAPNIKLRGAAPFREFNTVYTNVTGSLMTILQATGSFNSLQYMVDSAPWRLKDETSGAIITPTRMVSATDICVRGTDLDNAYLNFISAPTVQDMQLDCNNVAAGGLRIQGSAFFYVDGVSVINPQYVGFAFVCCFEFGLGRISALAPVPLLMIACESAMQDGGEMQLYSKASPAWIAGHQSIINSIIYPFNDPAGAWYGLTLKVIIVQWSINITFGYLSANLGNIGLELYHSNCNILHWENEFTTGGALFLLRVSKCRCDGLTTKSTGALSTGDGASRLIIREPGAIQCTTSFVPLIGETTSTFEVQVHNYFQFMPDPILGIVTQLSTVNVSKHMPNPGTVTLYVDTGGNTAISGMYQPTPTTLEGAMRFIINNPHIKNWTITLSPNQNHILTNPYVLQDIDVTISKVSGTNPTITMTNSLTLVNARLQLGFLSVTCAQPQLFLCQGIVNLEINNAQVSVNANGVIFACAPGTTAKVVGSGQSVNIAFGSSSGLCSGFGNSFVVYEDSFGIFSITGTPQSEAISSGRVKKIVSNVV